MKSPRKLLGCCLSVLLLMFLPTCYAQQAVSGMTGQVTDSSGAPVPNTVVTLSNKATGLKFTQTTTSDGSYRFANIPPGLRI